MNRYILIIVIAFVFASCKKKGIDTETQTSIDNSIVETGFIQVAVAAHSFAKNASLNNTDSLSFSCAKYSFTGDTANLPDSGNVTLIIDYGTGCKDKDGRVKKGKISCVLYNKWDSAGAKMDITFIDYFSDNVNYSGTANLLHHGNDSLTFNVVGGKASDTTFSIMYNCEKTMKQTSGRQTLLYKDDSYTFTGSGNGSSRNNVNFTTKITTPLIYKSVCKWIEVGAVGITPADLEERYLNYGSTGCDNKALITTSGNIFNFEMK